MVFLEKRILSKLLVPCWKNDYLLVTVFAYNTFRSPNLDELSYYQLPLMENVKSLLNIGTGTKFFSIPSSFKEYYELQKKLFP